MDSKPEFVQAKGTLETLFGLQSIGHIVLVEAILVVIVIRIVTAIRGEAGIVANVPCQFLFGGVCNEMVREGNVENEVGANGQFDFPCDLVFVFVISLVISTIAFRNLGPLKLG